MIPVISTRGLCKKYGSVTALDDINLQIESNGPIGLIGKNGAGKTTLLSILSGVLRPTMGSVQILGSLPDSAAIKGRVAILLQDANFRNGIPVKYQLLHFARLLGMSRDQAGREVNAVLKQTNNSLYAEQKPRALSYGQRKRLAIVQALIGKPELILLDEPTAGLDPIAASEIRKLIRNSSRDISFMVSSHNLYEIEDICKTIILLDKGRLVTHAPIADFATRNDTLNLVLDRPLTQELHKKISQFLEIKDIIFNDPNSEKFTIRFTSNNPDKLQLELQSLINEHGFSIVMLSRGKTLADGVVDMVETGN